MRNKAINSDEIEDLQRKIAFAEACADPINFDQMLNRVCSLLNKWAQADVVTLVLPPEEEGLEPMLHVFGQQPILPIAERSIRDDCSLMLADLEYADLPGEALRLRRGAELTPIHGMLRDDYMYRFWSQEMKLDGQTVGIVALYGFIDWVLSPRIRRLLSGIMEMLATGINNAAAIENLRLQSDRDELTGALNQRGIFENLDRECLRANLSESDLAVILCEIEDFESHLYTTDGDAFIQAFTEAAATLGRGIEIVGRLAESEFVIIMPECDQAEAQAYSSKLDSVMEGLQIGGRAFALAQGLACHDGGTADALLQRADDALFEARRQRALETPSLFG